MPSATVTSKGQLTLPKAIRDLLRLGAGDRVDFIVKDDGTVVLRPATVDVRELKGLLHRKGLTPLSVEEMTAIIRRQGQAGRAAGAAAAQRGRALRRGLIGAAGRSLASSPAGNSDCRSGTLASWSGRPMWSRIQRPSHHSTGVTDTPPIRTS